MAVRAKTKEATECRQCCAFCDKTIQPRGCIEADCPFLYTYEDEKSGRQYMGCLQKVFGVEIDVDMFQQGRAHARGLRRREGDARAAADVPVQRRASYEGTGAAFDCVNPRFFDAADGEPGRLPRVRPARPHLAPA